jgi:recombination protein RecA
LPAAIESAPLTVADKKKAIDLALSDVEKEYGKGTLIRMNDRSVVPVSCVPTGIYGVDYEVIGVGGFPRGRISEVFGPFSSGKTTIALTAVASAQATGGVAAYIDVEHSLCPSWSALLGVDVDQLLMSQPDYGEQALRVVERLLDTSALDIIVVDSVAALIPKTELDGELGDAHVGLQARMMSQAMRKLAGLVRRSNTALVFINQIREKIGVTWGSNETTPGGRALQFYASLRLDIRRIGQVKEGDEIVGNKTKIKCVKNKVSAPFREAEIELLYGRGFDKEGSLLTVATQKGVVEKAGAWFSWRGERLGQGHANSAAAIRENGWFEELLKAVREVDAI